MAVISWAMFFAKDTVVFKVLVKKWEKLFLSPIDEIPKGDFEAESGRNQS